MVTTLIARILSGDIPSQLIELQHKKGMVFSSAELNRFIEKEERHGIKTLTWTTVQALRSFSSGEQKKALLHHLLSKHPEYLILVDPYDNLDVASAKNLKKQLTQLAKKLILVQFVSRTSDVLPVPSSYYRFQGGTLVSCPSFETLKLGEDVTNTTFIHSIPEVLQPITIRDSVLVSFKGVSVSFYGKPVLKEIHWTIEKGDFWHLMGPNGSGKSTLLKMITGDSHKGYGQDLTLFGIKKGSGESVWDLKKNIGYFTPSMIRGFNGRQSLIHMLISGLHDSVGLYVKPSETELQLANDWLELLGLSKKGETAFREISEGEKRLLMTARAMIKHPPLLILDEPTVGLDDSNARSFVQLVNKMAHETHTAIIYVSHREEEGLYPTATYRLTPSSIGATGKIQ